MPAGSPPQSGPRRRGPETDLKRGVTTYFLATVYGPAVNTSEWEARVVSFRHGVVSGWAMDKLKAEIERTVNGPDGFTSGAIHVKAPLPGLPPALVWEYDPGQGWVNHVASLTGL